MYTPDKIKPHLQSFIAISNSFLPLLRGESGKTIRDIMAALNSVIDKDWFLELLCFLLNSFDKKQPSQEALADALKYFAEKKEEGIAPMSMEKPTE